MIKFSEIKLSSNAFKEIRDFIYEKSGMFFPDNKAYLLESRLVQRVKDKGCKSFEDYITALRYGADDEITALFNAVTINETSFFRDKEQLEAIVNGMLHEIVEFKRQKGVKSLKIWSAACSSGEEPYTMAIYLSEKQALLAGWGIEIFGSDISEAVLSAARRGIYGNYAVKNAPEHYLKRYFSSNGDGTHHVKPEIRQMVRFANVNLYDSQRLKLMREMDIILCRNVLIYFDDGSKRKVLSNLYDCLNPGGCLVIGRSESLHNLTRAFRPVSKDGMVIYKKA
jgi:chemotaxis protein methyltransferase CheR